jgi:hypothetical protein
MSAGSGSGTCEVCGDPIIPGTLNDILDHLRVMHPDVYGDGPEMWPDGGPVIEIDESVPMEAVLEWIEQDKGGDA